MSPTGLKNRARLSAVSYGSTPSQKDRATIRQNSRSADNATLQKNVGLFFSAISRSCWAAAKVLISSRNTTNCWLDAFTPVVGRSSAEIEALARNAFSA